jgi:hypothetical protein
MCRAILDPAIHGDEFDTSSLQQLLGRFPTIGVWSLLIAVMACGV